VGTKRLVRSEQGDTLLEILIAIVIISLTVTALLGALVTTLTTSTEHRSLSTLDTLLSSFAQSVENQVQGKSQQEPLFLNCPTPVAAGVVSPYQVLSAPVPAVGPAQTQVTVFLSGWAPGPVTATVGGTAPASYSGSPTVPASGDLALSFRVPSLAANGPQPVVVKDGAASAQAPTEFVYEGTASSGAPSVSGYSMGISSVEQWDPQAQPPTFDNAQPCVTSGMQRITATATSPSGVSAKISFIVFGAAQTTVAIAYQVPPSPAIPTLGNSITFQANVIPPNNTTPRPTGTITWDFAGSPGSPNCSGSTNDTTSVTSSTGNTGVSTCLITGALAGNYVVTATYNGDGNYRAATSATLQQRVTQANVTVAVMASSGAVPGGPVSFTATVTPPAGDPTPSLSDTVTWSFANTSPGTPQCAGTSGPTTNITPVAPGNGNTVTATCTITSASAGVYSVSAVFSGDTNYFSATAPAAQSTVAKATPTVTVSSAFSLGNSRLTFTAKVTPPAGDPVPTGGVSWAFTSDPGNLACTPNPGNLGGNPATTTCTVNGPQLGTYTVTATYAGNVSYNQAVSAPASATMPAGSNIQGSPNSPPGDGKPDSGDKVLYSYNQAMDPTSFANQWSGTGSLNVFAWLTRQGSVTSLTVCTSRFNCTNNNLVSLGVVTLGDTGATHYTAASGTDILNATLTLSNGSGQTVATLTLGSVAPGSGSPTAVAGTSTLTWTPSSAATSTGGTPSSMSAVSETPPSVANF